MAKCLYSGDKPLGIVQSNAEDVAYDSNTSVKEKIDEQGADITTLLGYYPIINGGNYFVTDLDIPQAQLTENSIIRHIYGTNTAHRPSNSGTCFTFTNNNKAYGRQIVISDGGIYTRTLSNGSYTSTWTTIV
jgi:hypothetical protein